MDLRQSFLQHLRRPEAEPPSRPTPPIFATLVNRLWDLHRRAGLPILSEDELLRILPLLDPELVAIAGDCAELLERRPTLGEAAGLSAPFLRELLQMNLQLSRLLGVTTDLGQTAARATAALWGALGAWNARVILAAQERMGDPALPLAERHHIQVQFRGVLGEAEQREAREQKGQRTLLRKADALRLRIDAAEKSRAVKDALDLLRRHGEQPGGSR